MHVESFKQRNPRVAPALAERMKSILEGKTTIKPGDKGIINTYLADYAKKVAGIKTGTLGAAVVAWEDMGED